MSGHSHWATIKRQKEASDSQRGKMFSKITRAISIAARDGVDPQMNFKLRLAIEKAKQINMPKENILRAIKRASREEGGEKWEEISFEGYGPEGIGVMVETVTDNRNRTTAEIKNIFERAGGSLASPGAVSYLFKRIGLITVKKEKDVNSQILRLIDLEVEDVQETDDGIEVFTPWGKLKEVKERIEKEGFQTTQEEIIMQPITPLVINNPSSAQKILKFMEVLEEHEDVQKVYSNFDIPNDILEKISSQENQ